MGRLSLERVMNRLKTTITRKQETMKKHLFKARLVSFAVLCGVALAFASCANDDVAQNPSKPKEESNKNLTAFVVGDTTKTRTSLDYKSGNFYWEAGDYIYVKDDDGVLQKSRNTPTKKVAAFKFMVPGKFTNHDSYKVYYLGKNSNGRSVKIPTNQSQTIPGVIGDFAAGDYGTATANKKTGTNQFEFVLEHQPTYLIFQPYTSNEVLQKCYLTKVEIVSDNDLAETYTYNSTTGALEASAVKDGNKIVLKTTDGRSTLDGFPLTNSSASVTTNGAYVEIKPGTHALTVLFYVKDYVTDVEGAIKKTYQSFDYQANTFYDMFAQLDVMDYDGDHYYMWDAKDQYWKGHEWNKGGTQPTLRKGLNGYTSSEHSPQVPEPGETPESRFYNPINTSTYPYIDVPARSPSFANVPNVNEMTWYAGKGDPHWDNDRLWTTMGHLYKGGVWLKKRQYIDNYNAEKAVDKKDWRKEKRQNSWPVHQEPIPEADADKYFYLPGLGQYSLLHEGLHTSTLENLGGTRGNYTNGYYWSSSGIADAYYSPDNHKLAYYFYIYQSVIMVGHTYRYLGFRVGGFE